MVNYGRREAEKFGDLRARLLDFGRPVSVVDLMIAAVAIAHGMSVVTHNVKDFEPVPGLHVEDWLS